MPNSRFKIAILFAALLAGSTANAQKAKQPEASKPIAFRGSFEARVDDKGNLTLTPTIIVPVTEERQGTRTVCKTVIDSKEETYTADVDGKKESRTRTIQVPRQVSEQVPYTYRVTTCKPEAREHLKNPKVLVVGMPFSREVRVDIAQQIPMIFSEAQSKSRPECLFVNTTQEAERVNQLIIEANNLLAQATGGGSQYFHIVVTEETFDYAAAAKATAEAKMGVEVLIEATPSAPAALGNAASTEWPLPTEKSAWINSLPFSHKMLDGKAMVLWFFEESCPKCKARWRDLNSLPLSFKGQPVIFVAVNSGNSPEVVAGYVKQNKVNLAVIADTDRQLEKLAGVGEISLTNIYQAIIMTPDGQLHRADASDLNATADAAVKLVK